MSAGRCCCLLDSKKAAFHGSLRARGNLLYSFNARVPGRDILFPTSTIIVVYRASPDFLTQASQRHWGYPGILIVGLSNLALSASAILRKAFITLHIRNALLLSRITDHETSQNGRDIYLEHGSFDPGMGYIMRGPGSSEDPDFHMIPRRTV